MLACRIDPKGQQLPLFPESIEILVVDKCGAEHMSLYSLGSNPHLALRLTQSLDQSSL